MTLTETAGELEGSGVEDRPGGAAASRVPPWTPPPRMRTQQEQEAVMRRGKGKGRGFTAGGKTRPASPQE